jgi:hypothetical protein
MDSDVEVSFLEKLIVNWSLPSDLMFHTVKSCLFQDEYSSQSFMERANAIYEGKIKKYYELLVIKKEHDGKIPERIKNICKQTPCGYTRLLLTYLR